MKFVYAQICLLVLSTPITANSVVLDHFDIQSGTDPFGGSYQFWTSDTLFWSFAAEPSGKAEYEEFDANGDGDEELVVSVTRGTNIVLHYIGNIPTGPFYSSLQNFPELSFYWENAGNVPLTLNLALQSSPFSYTELEGIAWQASALSSGIFRLNLRDSSQFKEFVESVSHGQFWLAVLVVNESSQTGTLVFDDFSLSQTESTQTGLVTFDGVQGEWVNTARLGWVYGVTSDHAYIESLGWIWHITYPWIYHYDLGWLYALPRLSSGKLILYSFSSGYLYHDPDSPRWVFEYATGDWVDLLSGDRFHEGPRPIRSVLSEQIEGVYGEWKWKEPSLPPLSSILAKSDPSRPVYGLYTWAHEFVQHFNFIKEIGWKNFRVSGPMSDDAMRYYVTDDFEVMFTLTARLFGTFASDPMSDWRSRMNYSSDEAFIEDFVTGVRLNISRYGPGGSFFSENPGLPKRPFRHFEIYNEPNFWYLDLSPETHRQVENNQTSAERVARLRAREQLYAKLLIASYDAIKAEWPEVNVVGFATGGSSSADVGFIANVHANDSRVGLSYDILSTHPYTTPEPIETISIRPWGSYSAIDNHNIIRQVMEDSHSASKPVWYTELNWSISRAEGGRYSEQPAAIPSLLQAAYYIRGYAMAIRLGVERLFYMSVVDTDNVNSGFLNQDRSWRPSAFAVQNMIRLLPLPKLTGALSDGQNQLFAYTFLPDAGQPESPQILMAWTITANNQRIELTWESSASDSAFFIPTERVRIYDMQGAWREYDRQDGPLSLQLGPLPQFVCPIP